MIEYELTLSKSIFRPPAKPKVKPALMKEDSTSIGGGSVDSMLSSNENLNAIDEPYYDIVAPETEGSILKSIVSKFKFKT